ncbi:hypothetical protein GCM10023184_19610 [Flaviaesturariibacter amylovorans]|uniref:Uncharacterized protein n=1 Tax=Flaviaesturariibacter amylovorans TaxID=1084520 RepID=A0ABP8GS78_9BACT
MRRIEKKGDLSRKPPLRQAGDHFPVIAATAIGAKPVPRPRDTEKFARPHFWGIAAAGIVFLLRRLWCVW